MATPVIVSRIQNRRGTQAQFDSLYPSYPGTGPNILQPGEIALCTDTHRIFIGNLNGTYDELGTATTNKIILTPLVIQLPPVGVFTTIPELSILPTPFFTYVYSLTDAPTTNINDIGLNFVRNGEMRVTCVENFSPIGLMGPVSLNDQCVEINKTVGTTDNDASFIAEYNNTSTSIDIKYKHDFPGNLILSTSSIQWADI